ncbi:MAG: octaprenyl diphosphate synthase [Legionellales bacterium]|nr:octaprenyl diphosphate synthase [Legionellales bacterium]
MDLTHIQQLVADDFVSVNQMIKDNLSTNIGLIDDVSQHIIDSGGKRLRPLLVLLGAKLFSYDQDDRHLKLAVAVEYFHTATLLHDDVVDESQLRRGKPTANAQWGNKPSILVGDYLFTQAFQLLIACRDLSVIATLTEAANTITCGETRQLMNAHNCQITLEDYLSVITDKTAVLFASATSLGGILAKRPPAEIEAMYQYGLQLGKAFQLVDDALDYEAQSDIIGKNIGDDLAEGKLTLPLIHILKHGDAQQQQLIRQSIQQGNLTHLPDILTALKATNAIEQTYQQANQMVNQAIEALAIIPDSIYRQALVALAQLTTSRNH